MRMILFGVKCVQLFLLLSLAVAASRAAAISPSSCLKVSLRIIVGAALVLETTSMAAHTQITNSINDDDMVVGDAILFAFFVAFAPKNLLGFVTNKSATN